VSPDYSSDIDISYRNFVTNTNTSKLNRDKLGFSARMGSRWGVEEPNKIARVMFYSRKKDPETDEEVIFYDSVPCKTLYEEDHKEDLILDQEFPDESWLCPKVDTIDLLNHPELFNHGSNFSLVVNRCDLAVQFSKDNGFEVADEVCADSATIEANIDKVSIEWKFLVQNFRPEIYRETQRMEPYVGTRAKADIVTTQVGNQNYRVSWVGHKYFGKLFADLSSWGDNFAESLDTFVVNLTTPSSYSANLFNNVEYGYYLVTLNQCELKTVKLWQIRTFQTVLAEYGGYAAIVTSFFAFLITPYQQFSYNRSLL